MTQHYFLHAVAGRRLAALLAAGLLTGALAAQAQPTITAVAPAANAAAASGTGSVSVTFSQPLTAASGAALKVFSQQRGGLRTRGTTAAVVNGNTLSFAPSAYAFKPGETVFSSVTTAAANSGGPLAKARVQQFTVAAGGQGRGTFAPGADPAVGTAPRSVAVADVDGDGDLDLLTANNGSNTVSVRLNGGNGQGNGRGTFSNGADVAVGRTPTSVVTADVDGDGDLDFLVVNSSDNAVGVHLNGGDATGSNTGIFGNGSPVGVGDFPTSVAVGDFDGDGDLDLVTANHGSGISGNTLSVRLNNGTGLFANGSEVTVGTTPQVVAVGDVDGDGDLDLVNSSYGSNAISVRLNGGNAAGGGTGTFSNGSEVPVATGPIGLALADVDRDGDLDMLSTSYVASMVSVRLNGGDATGSNTGTFSNGSTLPVPQSPINVAVGDVDSDGDLDMLVAVYRGAGAVSVFLNGGNAAGGGTGVFSSDSIFSVGSLPFNLALGDADGDGDLDILTPNSNSGTVSVRLNGGTQLAVQFALAPAGAAFAVLPTVGTGTAPRYVYTGPALSPDARLSLYSLTGRRVWEQAATAAPDGALPMAGLASGWYLVRLHTGSQSYVTRYFQP